MENQKSQQKPIINCTRLISINSTIQYCCIVNESTVAYIAGRSLVMENIRTLQQIILWISSINHDIITVTTNLSNQLSIQFAVVSKNIVNNSCQLVLLTVNQINYGFRKQCQKCIQVSECYGGKSLAGFDTNGEFIAVYTLQKNINYLTICNCKTSTITLKKRIQYPLTQIKPLKMKDEFYFILLSQHQLTILTNKGQQLKKTHKLYDTYLQKNEKIIQLQLVQTQFNQHLIFILSSIGNLIIFKILQNYTDQFIKINLQINQSNMLLQCQKQHISNTNTLSQMPTLSKPTCFQIHGTRIIICYQNIRKLIFLTYQYPKQSPSSYYCTQNQVYFPQQIPQQIINSNPKFIVNHISISKDFCTAALLVSNQDHYRFIMVVDILHCLSTQQRKINTSHRIFGNFSCKGICTSISYIERQNSLFILYTNNRNEQYLIYYLLNNYEITNQIPNKLSIWHQFIKIYTYQIYVHPCTFTLMLLQDQFVKLHHYTRSQLLQSHVTFHLSNCRSAAFSPYGDKIVIANSLGIFIIDNYTYEIINVVTPVELFNKFIKHISFISGFDFIVQLSHGNSTHIVSINNYSKVQVFGQIQFPTNFIHHSPFNDRFSCKLIDIDLQRNIIIVVIPGQELQFYNNNMEILNTLPIQVSCIYFCPQIQVLMVGTSQGSIILLKWPQIVKKTSPITPDDPEVITMYNVNKDRIISIKMSLNTKLLFVISQSCQLSILQFIKQNSSKLNKAISFQTLKKQKKQYITNYFLVQKTTNNNKTQQIINKDIQLKKYNQQHYQQYINNLQNNLQQQKNKINLCIKDQLSYLPYSKDVKTLSKKIQFIKNSLLSINNQKNQEIQLEQSKFTQNIRKLYQEKQCLENVFKSHWQKCTYQKNCLFEQNRKQRESLSIGNSNQMVAFGKEQNIDQIITKQMSKPTESQLNKNKEMKSEFLSLLSSEMDDQLSKQRTLKTTLQLSILTHHKQIPTLQTKNQLLSAQLAKIKKEINKTAQQMTQKNHIYQSIQQQIIQLKNKNQKINQLIQSIQSIINNQLKYINYYQHYYHQLSNNINHIQDNLGAIQQKIQSFDDKFCQQNQKSIQLTNNIEKAKIKITELREIKSKITQQLIIKVKNISKSSHQAPQTNINNPIKTRYKVSASAWKPSQSSPTSNPPLNQPTILKTKSINNNYFSKIKNGISQHEQQSSQNIIQKRDILCYQVSKLNKIKNDKIRNYKLFNQRIINDHKRLVLQFNQLKRFNIILANKQEKLKIQINNGSLNIQQHQWQQIISKNTSKVKIRKTGFISLYNGTININDQKIINNSLLQQESTTLQFKE